MNYFMTVFTEIGKRQREAVRAGRYTEGNAWVVAEDHWDRCFKGVSYQQGLTAFLETLKHLETLEVLSAEERSAYQEAGRLAQELWPNQA